MPSTQAAVRLEALENEVRKAFVGGPEPVRLILAGFIAALPVLIEDIPGVGKTTLARGLARASGMEFGRIQFTPDLLPGDITGMTVWSQEQRDFIYKPGAVMHQFILADEINRASARTQAALLEALQENGVTVDGVTHPLPRPFFAVATQNPSSFAGTFQLPEAQVDRFGISLRIGYPETEQEAAIVHMSWLTPPVDDLKAVLEPADVEEVRRETMAVRVDEKIVAYIVRIASETRRTGLLKSGMSPRASQHLTRAAQAAALLDGRGYVMPEDVRGMAVDVLKHRLTPSAQARLGGGTAETVLVDLINAVPMPSGLA